MEAKLHTTLYWKLTPASPVHVGGVQEKHRQLNVDAIHQDGKLYFINIERLAGAAGAEGIEQLAQCLAEGSLNSFFAKFKNLKPTDYSDAVFSAANIPSQNTHSKTDIKSFIRTNGEAYLPGSSIKGALRTVLGRNLLGYDKGIDGNIDEVAFGKIQNNLMRFLQVSDVVLPETKIVNSKVMSVTKSYEGLKAGWKSARQGSISELSPDTFNNILEVWPVGESVIVKINVLNGLVDVVNDLIRVENEEIIRKHKQNQKNGEAKTITVLNTNHQKLFKNFSEQNWLQILHTYSQRYFEKELKYLRKFSALKGVPDLIEFYEKCQGDKSTNFLRMSFGSGAWSMAGQPIPDFYAHVDKNIASQRPKDLTNKAIKTRRVALLRTGDDLTFMPMGWVKVEPTTEKDYLHHQRSLQHVKQEAFAKIEQEIAAQKEAQHLQEAQAAKAAEEAKKPVYTPWDKVKEGTVVDAICLTPDSTQKGKKFKLFIGDSTKEVIEELSYPSKLEADVVYLLKVKNRIKGKEKIQGLEFKGEKNGK